MADPQFSRGDLVWFDPGIGYVLPGEVTEFHPQAQVRNSDNSEELYSFTSASPSQIFMTVDFVLE